jgi:hypothetical protein
MQSSVFAKWVRGHQFDSHVVLPAVMSLLLIAMYFSGNAYLQQLVAPKFANMPLFSAREFGILEILQNILLLGIVFYATRCVVAAGDWWVKLAALLLVVVSVFTFLEEIDYGIHVVEYITGDYGSLEQENWSRNWHNRTGADGVQNVSHVKLAANLGLLSGFVIAPLLLSSVRNRTIRMLLPLRWTIATVALIALLSVLAHYLDDAGYAVIGGEPGNLHKNISEFREMNMYYLMLVYVAVLHERVISNRSAPIIGNTDARY